MTWIRLGIYLLLFRGVALAHAGHSRDDLPVSGLKTSEDPILAQINHAYVQTIRPIFEKKCFDCHSNQTRYPWYYHLPGVHQYIARDVAEGRRRVDMSDDFPFKGHNSPEDDLDAIVDIAQDHTMPPNPYCWLHRGARLTPDENSLILKWAQTGLQRLDSQD